MAEPRNFEVIESYVEFALENLVLIATIDTLFCDYLSFIVRRKPTPSKMLVNTLFVG